MRTDVAYYEAERGEDGTVRLTAQLHGERINTLHAVSGRALDFGPRCGSGGLEFARVLLAHFGADAPGLVERFRDDVVRASAPERFYVHGAFVRGWMTRALAEVAR